MYGEKVATEKLKQKRDLPRKMSPLSVYFKMACFGGK